MRTTIQRIGAAMLLLAFLVGTTAAALAAGQGRSAQATATLTFAPVADAYVIQSQASSNFGAATNLRADSSPVTRSYLRFTVSGLNGGTVQSAKLRVYVNSTNRTGISVLRLSNLTWSESGITFNNSPAPGTVINRSGAFSAGAWVEVDVTAYVKTEATYSIVVTTASSTNINMSSREAGANGPQLVVVASNAVIATATATGLPPTATPTGAPAFTPTATPAAATIAPPTDTGTSAPPTAAPPSATATSVPPTSVPPSPTPTAVLPTAVPPTAVPPTAVPPTATIPPYWQPIFPIRATFYYPWFPEAWKQSSIYPYTNYTPSLGFYSSTDQTVLKQHIDMMQYANIQAGIASWWGQGSQTDTKIGGLLQAAAGTNFRWALYYENESQGDPTPTQIENDLIYIRDRYSADPSFLRVNGKFVVFVYSAGNDACGMVDRWKQGNTVGAYVVLKVFSGYRLCTNQPDSWHQYSPAVAADRQSGYSYSISPGFWQKGQTVRLARDLTRWSQNVRDMVASGTNWELVTTFSEWGEGTAVEPAVEWSSTSGFGQYLDALHYNGNTP